MKLQNQTKNFFPRKENKTIKNILINFVWIFIATLFFTAVLASYFRNYVNVNQEIFLICDGNSLMEGTILEKGESIGDRLQVKLDSAYSFDVKYKNVALGGSNIFYQDSMAKIKIDPFTKRNYGLGLFKFYKEPLEVIVILAGTNELKEKGSGIKCYEGYMNYARNRHLVSPDLMICFVTIPDAISTYINAEERERLNTKLRLTEEKDWLKIIDVNIRTFDKNGACKDSQYYLKDSIHLNSKGSDVIASSIFYQLWNIIDKNRSSVSIQDREYYYVKNTDAGKIINLTNELKRVVYLPDAHKFKSGSILHIKDAAGTASTANIVVKSSCAQKVDNSDSNIIANNHASRAFYSDGFHWYVQGY